jgi:hypothetical protein
MKFDPTEKKKEMPEPGDVSFEIIDAEEGVSRAGNEQIKLKIRTTNSNGDSWNVYEYLLTSEKFKWKIKAVCQAIGEHALYDSGCVTPADFIGKSGKAKTVVQVSEGYNDQLKIGVFLEASDEPKVQEDFNDDIPF